MEAYKSTCPTCKRVYFWQGYKTGLGKTPEQLAEMRKRETVCKHCGAEGLKTEADRESPTGRVYAEMDDQIVKTLVELIEGKLKNR